MSKKEYILALCLASVFLFSCAHTNEHKYAFIFYGSHLFNYNTPGNNFLITTEDLNSFTKKIEHKKTDEAIKLGNKIFRINARLPEKYRKLLTKYQKGDNTEPQEEVVYIFDDGNGYKLYLTISRPQAIVESFNVKMSSSGNKIKITPDYVTDKEAFQLLKNYFDFYENDGERCTTCPEHKPKGLKPIKEYSVVGMTIKKRIRVIELSTGRRDVEQMFIMDNLTGKILVKNPMSCARASSWVYPSAVDMQKKKEIMVLIVCLNELVDPFFISKPSDIPSYEKSKLDSDIEKAIIAPFTIINKQGNNITYGAYTYESYGGIVRRYQFHFTEGVTSWAKCIELDKHIGNAKYIE